MLQDGEIVSGMAGAGAHLIVGEGHIHAPMQAVLHGPMRPHCLGQTLCIGGKAADVKTTLKGGLAVYTAFRFDHRKGFQVEPLFRPGQAVQLIEGIATAGFQAPVIFLDRLERRVRGTLRLYLELGKEVKSRIESAKVG